MARKTVNPELLKRAKASAEAAMARREQELAMEKAAVIPAGGDPSMGAAGAPMDPSMAGGAAPPMDPSMAGAAPPADPSMGGAPPASPTDPMLAAAGGGIGDMVNSAVQQALAAQGGGKGGPGGKGAKPDVAVELQKLCETVYKLGLIVTAIANAQDIQLPAAALLGPPPEQADPALAQAAASVPAPAAGPSGSDPSQAAGGDPAMAGGDPSMAGMDPATAGLAAAPDDASTKAAAVDMEKLGRAGRDLGRMLGLDSDDEEEGLSDFLEIMSGHRPEDVASRLKAGSSAPDPVGRSCVPGSGDAFAYGRPREAPMTLAGKIRARVRG